MVLAKIKPPMFDINEELYDVNVWVPIYPGQALDYLIKQEVLSETTQNKIKAYLFHSDINRTEMVDVSLSRDDPKTMKLSIDKSLGRVNLGEAKIINYVTFVVIQGDRTLRDRWTIIGTDYKTRTVVVPRKDGLGNMVTTADRDAKNANIYHTKEHNIKITISPNGSAYFDGVVPIELDLSKAYTVAERLCVNLRSVDGSFAEVCADLDVEASEQSQVLKQFIKPIYNTIPGAMLENKQMRLRIMPTHVVRLEPNVAGFEKAGLQNPGEYQFGKVQYQFNRGQYEEIASLMQTYNDFRTEFAKTLVKPARFHLIDQPSA